MRSGHNSIHALPIVSKRRRRRCRSNGKKRITICRNFTLSSCVTNIKRGIAWITHQRRERASKAKSRPLLCFWMFAVYLNHCFVGFAILCFSSYLFHFFTTYFFPVCCLLSLRRIAKQNEIQLTLTFVRHDVGRLCIFYMRLVHFFSSPSKYALILFLFAFLAIYLSPLISLYYGCVSVCVYVSGLHSFFWLLTPCIEMRERATKDDDIFADEV